MIRPPKRMSCHCGRNDDTRASSQPKRFPPRPRNSWSRVIGSMVMKTAPKIEPRMLPSPPMMTMARNWIEIARVNIS